MLKDIISTIPYIMSALKRPANLVLVYHSIAKLNPREDLYKLNIQPDLFNEHLNFLLSQYNSQEILLTFDDGFGNFFDNAFPLIVRYNMPSLLFITTGFIDGKVGFGKFFRGGDIKPLTERQIKEVSDSGVIIGSHSITHRNLKNLDDESLIVELKDSKKSLEDITGRPVQYFAYPFGSKSSFDRRVEDLVRECGYEKAYTNIMGFNHTRTNPYALRRIRLYSDDNLFRFKMKIRGAYNWVDWLSSIRQSDVKE